MVDYKVLKMAIKLDLTYYHEVVIYDQPYYANVLLCSLG